MYYKSHIFCNKNRFIFVGAFIQLKIIKTVGGGKSFWKLYLNIRTLSKCATNFLEQNKQWLCKQIL